MNVLDAFHHLESIGTVLSENRHLQYANKSSSEGLSRSMTITEFSPLTQKYVDFGHIDTVV